MANFPFLTTFARHRDPKLLWPVAAVASILAHGVALGLVRILALQTPTLPQGAMAPLPIQLVDLPPDQPAPAPITADAGSSATPPAPSVERVPLVAQTTPMADSPTAAPAIAPSVSRPPVAPAPRPTPAPATAAPPTVAPAPPRPEPPLAPAPVVERPPRVETPPTGGGSSPGAVAGGMSGGMAGDGSNAIAQAPGGTAGRGGQVVPVDIRLNPSGRDIPETPPQLLGSVGIEVRPLASGCGFANLDALLAGFTSASVQMQIRVEPSGDISDVRLLQGTGNSAVDDLVGCVVRQRLKLQPATSAGVPQLTDAFILDAQVQF